MLKNILKTFSLGLLCLSACQPEQSQMIKVNPVELSKMLHRGRVSSRNLGFVQESHQLALQSSSPDVHKLFYDRQGNVNWVLFDTEAVSKINENELSVFAISQMHRFEQVGLDKASLVDPRITELAENLLSLQFRIEIQGVQLRDGFAQFVFAKTSDSKFQLREIVRHVPKLEELPGDRGPEPDLSELFQELNWPQAQVIEQHEWWLSVSDQNPNINQPIGSLLAVSEYTIINQGERYSFLVDRHRGELVEAYTHHLHVQVPAPFRVQTMVYDRSYLDQTLTAKPLPFTEFVGLDKIFESSADGWLFADEQPAYARLKSSRAVVKKASEDRATVVIADLASGQDANTLELYDQSKETALNAYVAVHRVNRFARQFLSETELPFLDKPVEVTVDMDGNCNAYYTTIVRKISLFTDGQGCANVALINDVIYHEWGHGLDDHTGLTVGVTDGAFSEGISDIVAAYFTGDPEIGRGFLLGSNYGIRNISRLRVYPDDTGEVHREGGIIANTFWSLREALRERYGVKKGSYKAAKLFFRHLLDTDSYLDSYRSVLRLDDDDANPATPSPNFCLINAVFAERGLADSEPCEDAVELASQVQKVDNDLSLALTEFSNGLVTLIASSSHAEQMSLCLGDRQSCLRGAARQIDLDSLGAVNGRFYYASSQQERLKALDLITIIAKNGDGLVTGSRVVKAVEK